MHGRSSDDRDNDPTDELPVLLETAGLDEDLEPPATAPRAEDTAEHTALFSMVDEPALSDARLAELETLAERAELVPGLEAQIRSLTDSARDLEHRVAERDERIDELQATLAELQRAQGGSGDAQRRLASELAVRDARVAELSKTVARHEQEAAAYASELQRLFDTAEAAKQEAASLRQELAARQRTPAPRESDSLREDHAALAAYIAGRRAWWEGMEATNTQLAARVTSLEHELGARAKRLAAAEAFAAKESQRAVGLRAELVEYARRVDELERELKLARGTGTQPARGGDEPALAPLAQEAPAAPAESTPAPPVAVAVAVSEPPPPVATAQPAPPVLTDAVETAGPGVEALAQLEAEVEYKRQQVAAQVVELRDREQRLRTVAADLERTQRELGALRAELDESRASTARLERAIIDKDRALEARDARIATLQEELQHRLAAAAPVEPAVPRAALRESDSITGPALICLTGDAPKRFPLTRKTITIGRGPHCDLQVVTHFVSREHARLTFNGNSAFIEDLGSRNGVFVNAVRVDRQQLQQGDLLTIGETQFRFVESMAH